MALNGSLDDYSPAGALRVLSSDGRTGAVRFAGSGGCTVYLHEGQLYFARGDDTDDALASALVRPGRLTAEMWTRAVDEAGDAPRVGELLVEHGAIDPDLLASVALSVIYDPLITLFREGDGQFEFEPDTMHWIGAYRGFNVEAIVNEVRKRVRGVDEMSDVVPSLSAWVSPRRTLPHGAAQVTLLREDWELITALSGPRTVMELASSMGRGHYSTAAVVNRLARASLLEVVGQPFPTSGSDDALHEPSAAERMAAATSGPGDGGSEAGDDDAWEQWARGNPFDHDPEGESEGDDPTIAFSPGMNGAAAGPEAEPEQGAALPRRAAVREADPLDHTDDDIAKALAGISGFHDPVAEAGRDDAALAEALAAPDERDPNAAWLENLYAQFIDDAEDGGKTRKKEVLDVAFQAPEQADTEKVGTLRRLVDALRRV